MYSMFHDIWIEQNEGLDYQFTLACGLIYVSSVCQFPGDKCLNIDQQTHDAVNIVCCVLILTWSDHINYSPTYPKFMLNITSILGP